MSKNDEVSYLPKIQKAQITNLKTKITYCPGEVVPAWNPSTPEAKTAGFQLKASLGYKVRWSQSKHHLQQA